jgi:diadenylate cyclase
VWLSFSWRNLVDFLVLAGAFYVVLRWAARARALRIALTITALYVGSLFARRLELIITSWILQAAALVALALLVVLFQPEVRRALMGIDRQFLTWPRRTSAADQANRTVADAAFALAAQRIGALFAMVRRDPLVELVEGGIAMAAEITPGLIDAIFQTTSPLHDGAVVIQNGRIARANAVLPLTQRPDVPAQFGTRHRAAMGLAERTDAFVIAVSEERGQVTVMQGRDYRRVESAEQLALMLNQAFTHIRRPLFERISLAITAHWRLKLAALALAAMIWGVATLESGTAVRTVSVPIEFRNVPRGLDIADQSAAEIEVQLRGRTWMLDTMNMPRLVARFDLGNSKEGVSTVQVEPDILPLPPGVVIMRVTPSAIRVHLVHRHPPGSPSKASY